MVSALFHVAAARSLACGHGSQEKDILCLPKRARTTAHLGASLRRLQAG
jgi:hypothetical protein